MTSWQVANVTPRARVPKSNIIPIPTYMDVRPREPSRWFSSSSSSLYSVVSVVQRALYNILLYCCCEPVCTVHACHLYYIIIDCINILLYIIILLYTHVRTFSSRSRSSSSNTCTGYDASRAHWSYPAAVLCGPDTKD